MHQNRRVLGLVPARGGSKGLPDKNLADLGGRPLIQWTVEAARQSEVVDDVIVSTDSQRIAEAAEAAGARVPFLRPAELATDTSHMVDVIAHALDTLHATGDEFGYVALLQPTSPLRTAEHVDAAFARLAQSGGRAVVSVCQSEHSPQWMGLLPDDGNMKDFLSPADSRVNRQELSAYFRLNGAIYIAEVEYWREHSGFLGPYTFAYVMDPRASVDVDTPFDLEVAGGLLSSGATAADDPTGEHPDHIVPED
jgi:CMP-N-acetylneuraminic acid synthetase